MKKETLTELSIGMAGSGGDGVITAGDFIASAMAAMGLSCLETKAYGPQIRGGESSVQVRLGRGNVRAPADALDCLGVLSWRDFKLFRPSMFLAPGAVVLYDEKDPLPPELTPHGASKGAKLLSLPITEICREATGNLRSRNMVLLGMITEIFGLPLPGIHAAVKRKFAKKKAEIAEKAIAAVDAGVEFVRSMEIQFPGPRFTYTEGAEKILLTGNDALGLGAVRAGCRFYAGYPITPASDILHFMERNLPRLGGRVVQAEDEIAAVTMAIGSSFGGVPGMTASAGPGIALMGEAMGLATMAEIPLVVIDVQRGGPSTGIPTLTEQGDLNMCVFGAHGDAPRVVVAPVDVGDAYLTGALAVRLSEQYQTLCVVLSDQFIGQRKEALAPFEISVDPGARRKQAEPVSGEKFRRYAETGDHISPIPLPGVAGTEFQISGLEHNDLGNPTSSPILHQQMSDKRAQKLEPIRKLPEALWRYGNDDGEHVVLAWGSTAGTVSEAVDRATADGISCRVVAPRVLTPLPIQQLTQALEGAKTITVIELTHSGQFMNYLKSQIEFPVEPTSVRRSGGRPFGAGEVHELLREIAGVAPARKTA